MLNFRYSLFSAAMVFIASAQALACPNLSGTYRRKDDTANITVKYVQSSCSELKISVSINGQEQPDPLIYQADGTFRADNSKPLAPAYTMSVFTPTAFVANTLLASYDSQKNSIGMTSAKLTRTLEEGVLYVKTEYFNEDGSVFLPPATDELNRIGE